MKTTSAWAWRTAVLLTLSACSDAAAPGAPVTPDAGAESSSVDATADAGSPGPGDPPIVCTTQCHYVRAGAPSGGSGDSWDQAYADFPSTLKRGDVYFVAAGSYPAHRFDTPAAGDAYVTIRRATVSDHGTETGWSAAYGVGAAEWTGTIDFDTDRWIFDGATRNEADWFDGASYGFRVSGGEQQIRAGQKGKPVSNVEIRRTYLLASNSPLPNTTIRRYGLDLYSWGGVGTYRGIVVSRSYFRWGNVPIFASGNKGANSNDGMLVELSAFDTNASNDANHGEAMSCYYTCQRTVVRFNRFRNVAGTAVIAIGGTSDVIDGFEFYGNVVWGSNTGDGVVGFSEPDRSNFTNAKIYNNTIANKKSGFNNGVAIMTGSNNVVTNNVWYDTPGLWNGPGTKLGTNVVNPTNSPFVNAGASDYRLAAPVGAGTTLPAPWDVDLTGRKRGGDGVWDPGAFELGP